MTFKSGDVVAILGTHPWTTEGLGVVVHWAFGSKDYVAVAVMGLPVRYFLPSDLRHANEEEKAIVAIANPLTQFGKPR